MENSVWASKGLRKVLDLYKDKIFMTFAELVVKYDIPKKKFIFFFF